MPDRSKLKQSPQPGPMAVRVVVILTWALSLLIVCFFGAVFQSIYEAYRTERADGPAALAAAPYRHQEHEAARPEKRAAIIIDDLGMDLCVARGFWELEIPVTLAVLPYQRYSREVAREAFRHGKEVILHLPLQPKEYPAVNSGTGSLLLSMDREEMQREIAAQLDGLPQCVGVSSHMGSLFTQFAEPVRWVLSVVAERRLFFVDSLTTPNSVVADVARELAVPFVQRTHFLDLEKTEDFIIRQLCSLADSAVRQGGAIGIVHPSEEALSALPKVIPAFAEKGVRLVPVSEMVSSYEVLYVQGGGGL